MWVAVAFFRLLPLPWSCDISANYGPASFRPKCSRRLLPPVLKFIQHTVTELNTPLSLFKYHRLLSTLAEASPELHDLTLKVGFHYVAVYVAIEACCCQMYGLPLLG